MMKLVVTILVVSLMVAGSVSAADNGFSAHIGGGLVVVNRADNMWGNGYSTIQNLNEKPHSTTYLLPIPLVELSYKKDSNEYYFGRFADEPVGMTAGVKHTGEAGVISGSLFYSFLNREWEDPYLVGAPRQDTLVNLYGIRSSWDRIYGSSFGLDYRLSFKNVDKDTRGEVTPELKRDGMMHEVSASWKPVIGRFVVGPALVYERGDFDGRSSSYDRFGANISVAYRGDRYMAVLKGSGSIADYDATHPIFGRTQHDRQYGASALITYFQPFGLEKTFISSGIVLDRTTANIDFFESQSTVGFAVMGYNF